MTFPTDRQPPVTRVWIGCLSCYNSGFLVGEWYPAVDADEVTVYRLHQAVDAPKFGCEELWVLDHENLPVKGELSTSEAAEWGRLIESVPARERAAFLAYCQSPACDVGDDLPSVEAFRESYCGTWDSLRDYADHLAEDCAVFVDVPDHLIAFIDYESWARQVGFDHVVVDVEDSLGLKTGQVYVFRL